MRIFKFIAFAFTLIGCAQVKTQSVTELFEMNPKTIELLTENQIVIIDNISSIQLYAIKKQLIQGTKDEYSNKNIFVRTLNESEKVELLSLIINDDNYYWDSYEKLNFNPTKQIIIKDTESQFMILYSEDTQQIGFIDLQGQKVLKIGPELNKYFQKI
ncbi:hypothetical protein [Urechidicola croceus]|uniref:Lipoprotein n=1 Tax=Urechidicola croceus TaxID=1850246 RepID=A0A1D8P6Z6_9FLAO|nr:hypothetical protein [Urechidicola croceus]AOW20334.1 hypothetical protein LPB138_06415 [Urechidicola croceus]